MGVAVKTVTILYWTISSMAGDRLAQNVSLYV